MLLIVVHNLCKNVWRTKSSQLFILSNCLFILSSAIWYLRRIEFVALSGVVLAGVDNVVIWFWRVLGEEYVGGDNRV